MPINETEARRKLKALLDDFDKLTPEDRKTMSEASVVRQFIDRLLEEVLGWPIKDPARYKYEMHTQAGRPDLTLIPESGGVIFVEAKKFGVIKELEQARYTAQGVITPGQMALPGMSVDRTAEEQQAINYAFANDGTWAILTNFERLRVFNARRDWLVLSFERPGAYVSEFDQLWQLAYHNVIKGSLDALSNQRYARDIDSAYLDFINEWRLNLARDIIKRRALNRWAFKADGGIDLTKLREVVQRFLDRLVIARFAEDWLLVPPGTLRQFYEMRRTNIYTPSMDGFLDTFFRRFDDEHNSALFAYHRADTAIFSDLALLPLIDKLYEVRFRAMPADILGNTYEQYLGRTLALDNGSVTTRDNLETRKKQGSYYTPQVIVKYIVDNSLGRYLYGTADGKPDGDPLPGETRKTSRDILDLRCLDSACGSGAFLIYAYQVLADFYEHELERLENDYNQRVRDMAARFDQITLDDRVGAEALQAEMERIRTYPRLILETHLYGVDLDPQAAELATVNLIMRAVESRRRERRLPLILGQSVKVGNGLVGNLAFTPPLTNDPHPPTPSPLRREGEEYQAAVVELLRLRHLLTTDPDIGQPQPEPERDRWYDMTLEEARRIPNPIASKQAVEAIQARDAGEYVEPEVVDTAHRTYYELLAKTRALADQLDADLAPHFSDLSRVRPFHWDIEFPEVFYNDDGLLKDNPGFTIIFGNPPWEIVMPDEREYYAQFDPRLESRLQGAAAEARIAELDAEDPRRRIEFEAQKRLIEESAAYFHDSDDYQHQGTGHVATHKLFTERMYGLIQNGGRLGYVIPSGIYTDLGTKALRILLFETGQIEYMYGFANVRGFFSDVDSRFKFTLLGVQKGGYTEQFRAMFLLSHAQWPHIADGYDAMAILFDVLNDKNRVFVMGMNVIKRFNHDSLSVMEFQTHKDYEIAEKMFGDLPLLGDNSDDTWIVRFAQELNLTSDRDLFNGDGEGVPLYEGRMFHQYNAFYAEPRYWVNITEASNRVRGRTGENYQHPRLVFRDVARSTDERTVISAILPPNVFAGHTAIVECELQDREMLYFGAILNTFCFDWIARFKVGTHVTFTIMQSLPIPRLSAGNPYFDAIVPRAARLTCTRPEFDDLWHAVMGNVPPLHAMKRVPGGEVRQQLRDEIDALVAHLYGLSRDEYDHILGTFPLVFPDNAIGQARRAATLAVYDASEVQGVK